MYFVPQKGKVYRWAVHSNPAYRYLFTCSAGLIIFGGYYFLLQPWLSGAVELKRAVLNRSEQQSVDMVSAERAINQFTNKFSDLKKQNAAVAENYPEQDQLLFVFDAAEKAGLSLNSFAHAKEKKKGWKSKRYKSLQANGTFDQITKFLTSFSKDSHLIQCKQLALQRADNNLFTMQCQVEFIQRAA